MDLFIEMLPIESMRQPSIHAGEVKNGGSNLPSPREGVNEEDVPRERN